MFLTTSPGLRVARVCTLDWGVTDASVPVWQEAGFSAQTACSLLTSQGGQPPSSVCLLRQTAVISSPRAFSSAPEAPALSIPRSFSLLTLGLVLGLDYV